MRTSGRSEGQFRRARRRLESAILVSGARLVYRNPRELDITSGENEEKKGGDQEDPRVLPAGKLRRMRPSALLYPRRCDIVSRLRGGSPCQPIGGCVSRVMPQDTNLSLEYRVPSTSPGVTRDARIYEGSPICGGTRGRATCPPPPTWGIYGKFNPLGFPLKSRAESYVAVRSLDSNIPYIVHSGLTRKIRVIVGNY